MAEIRYRLHKRIDDRFSFLCGIILHGKDFLYIEIIVTGWGYMKVMTLLFSFSTIETEISYIFVANKKIHRT